VPLTEDRIAILAKLTADGETEGRSWPDILTGAVAEVVGI
jgi:hypothetical protein